MKDHALDQLSVAFGERQNRRLAAGVVERVTADLRAVAIVMAGAYGELASIAAVRSAQLPVAAEELDLQAQVEEFLRPGGVPDLPDYDLRIRAVKLGMPY